MLHAAPAVGTMIALSIACTCCIFYLLESYLLRQKYPLTPLLKLPSLEWSLSVFRISCAMAMGCLCFCALGGVLLNFYRNAAAVWHDPLIMGTLCLLLILLLGSLKWLFHSSRTTENRFVFMLVVIVFITFLSILVGVLLFNHDAHWNKQRSSALDKPLACVFAVSVRYPEKEFSEPHLEKAVKSDRMAELFQ
jgi:RsiW-degrading membrane proteinase PrsW (M82 family)